MPRKSVARPVPRCPVPKPEDFELPTVSANGPTMEAVKITGAMDKMVLVSLEVRDLMRQIWLLEYAHVGVLHTAVSLKVPPDELTDYCELTEQFESLHGHAHTIFDRCVEVIHELGGKTATETKKDGRS